MVERTDPAQRLYAKKNAQMDLTHDVDVFAMWAFYSVLVMVFFFFIGLGGLNRFMPLLTLGLAVTSLVRIERSNRLKGRTYAGVALVCAIILMLF